MKKKLSTKVIPKGLYCHDEEDMTIVCPYWSKKEKYDKHENGYCSYLKKGDYEINREPHVGVWTSFKDGKEEKTWEVKYDKKYPDNSSLIWDKVKECGMNMGYKK